MSRDIAGAPRDVAWGRSADHGNVAQCRRQATTSPRLLRLIAHGVARRGFPVLRSRIEGCRDDGNLRRDVARHRYFAIAVTVEPLPTCSASSMVTDSPHRCE